MTTKAQPEEKLYWAEKGITEWREIALRGQKEASAARATARIAIAHLQAVTTPSHTEAEQVRVYTAARDWLTSIGSD